MTHADLIGTWSMGTGESTRTITFTLEKMTQTYQGSSTDFPITASTVTGSTITGTDKDGTSKSQSFILAADKKSWTNQDKTFKKH